MSELSPNRRSDGKQKSNLKIKTFIYYVLAISITTVVLAEIASWATAYWRVHREITEENDALLAEREQERRAGEVPRRPTRGTNAQPEIELQTRDLDYERNVRSIRSALQLNPDDVRLRLKLASLLEQKGSTQEEIDVLREGVKVSPYASEIRVRLASALEKDGREEEAYQEYRALTNVDSRSPQHCMSMARIAERRGHASEALSWYKRAAGLDKAYESVYDDALNRLSQSGQ